MAPDLAGADPVPRIEDEDRARAQCYALVSRLFYAAPDAALLSAMSAAPSPDAEAGLDDADGFPAAYDALRRACESADPETVRQEYDDLFVAAGKAPVSPYTSGYIAPTSPDRHLLALRERLAQWGLARREAVFEVEDHVSAVCDVMRWLIEHDRPVAEQRLFFDAFVDRGVAGFCDAIKASPVAAFYVSAATVARAFLRVEREAFDMHVEE